VVTERDKETKEVVKERANVPRKKIPTKKKLNKIGTHTTWQQEFRSTLNNKYFRLPI